MFKKIIKILAGLVGLGLILYGLSFNALAGFSDVQYWKLQSNVLMPLKSTWTVGGVATTVGPWSDSGNYLYPTTSTRELVLFGVSTATITNSAPTGSLMFLGNNQSYSLALSSVQSFEDSPNYEGSKIYGGASSTDSNLRNLYLGIWNNHVNDAAIYMESDNESPLTTSKIDFWAGRAKQITLDSSGLAIDSTTTISKDLTVNANVGINTAPGKVLDIKATNDGMRLLSGFSTAYTSFAIGRTAEEGDFSVAAAPGQFAGIATSGDIVVRSRGNNLIFTNQNGKDIVFTAGPTALTDTEKMRITNDGFVGIGTAEPNFPLHVSGASLQTFLESTGDSSNILDLSSNVTKILRLGLSDSSGAGVVGSALPNEAILLNYPDAPIGFWTSSTRRMIVAADGNIGIGTESPSTPLHVKKAELQTLFESTGDTFNTLDLMSSSSEIFRLGIVASDGTGQAGAGANEAFLMNYREHPLSFWTNASRRMTIASDGKVGVGIESPAYNLQVIGASDNLFAVGTSGASDLFTVTFNTSTGGTNQGIVGIGTSTPGRPLTVVGSYNGNDRGQLELHSVTDHGYAGELYFADDGTFLHHGIADSAYTVKVPGNAFFATQNDYDFYVDNGYVRSLRLNTDMSWQQPMKYASGFTATPSCSSGSMPDGTYYYAVIAGDEASRYNQGARYTTYATVSCGDDSGSVNVSFSAIPGAIIYAGFRSTSSDSYPDPNLVYYGTATSFDDTAAAPTPSGVDPLALVDNIALASQISPDGYTFFNGGNVGIGTQNPDSLLQVKGSADAIQLKVNAFTGQSSDIVQVIDNAGNTTAKIDATGAITGFTNSQFGDVANSKYWTLGTYAAAVGDIPILTPTSPVGTVGAIAGGLFLVNNGAVADGVYFGSNADAFATYDSITWDESARKLLMNTSTKISGDSEIWGNSGDYSATSSVLTFYNDTGGFGSLKDNGEGVAVDFSNRRCTNKLGGSCLVSSAYTAGLMSSIVEDNGDYDVNYWGSGLGLFTANETGLNERLRITHDGNVGIGVTTTSYKLEVNGTASLGTTTAPCFTIDGVNCLSNYDQSLNTTDNVTFNHVTATEGITAIAPSATHIPLKLTGYGGYGSYDPDEGTAFVNSYNGTGNRQLALYDSAQVGDSSKWGFRFILGFPVGIIDGINGDQTAGGAVIIGQSGENVGIGYGAGTTQGDLTYQLQNSGTFYNGADATFNTDVHVGSSLYLPATVTSTGNGIIYMNNQEYLWSPGTYQSNIMLGYQAGNENLDGARNIGIGGDALDNLLTSDSNIAIGDKAMETAEDAYANVCIGTQCLWGATSTNITRNVALGYIAGYSSMGSYNTFIGAGAGVSASYADYSYSSAIGAYAKVATSNAMVLGNVDDDIKVGIGISAPTAILQVMGNTSTWPVLKVGTTTNDSIIYVDYNGNTYLGGYNSGNYTQIETDGTIYMAGNATVWDDLRMPLSMAKAAGVKDPGFDQFSATSTSRVWAFDGGTTEEELFFTTQVPHGYKLNSNLLPHLHLSPSDSNTGVIVFKLECDWSDTNGNFASTSVEYATTTIASASALKSIRTDFSTTTAINFSGLSGIIDCRISRTPTGGDTYPSDVFVHEIDWHYEIDMIGSRTQTTK